jgi:hypothetical protein
VISTRHETQRRDSVRQTADDMTFRVSSCAFQTTTRRNAPSRPCPIRAPCDALQRIGMCVRPRKKPEPFITDFVEHELVTTTDREPPGIGRKGRQERMISRRQRRQGDRARLFNQRRRVSTARRLSPTR